jgi:SP family arabinose:H+ symporter-like MFS transporter
MNNKLYTFLIAIIVAMGGFLMGFDASVISGAVGFIEVEFMLSKLQLGWAVSCLTLTAAAGMAISGPLSDKIGRKKVLSYSAIIFFVSAVLSAFAPNFVSLVIARMIGGFGVGASLILAPTFIAEIAPPNMRGKLVSLNQLNIVLGISVAFFANYLILQLGKSDVSWVNAIGLERFNWRYMLGVEAIPAMLYFFLLFLAPESPRWLLMKGKEDQAYHIFLRLNKKEDIASIMQSVRNTLAGDKEKKKVKIKELFHPSLKLVLLIGVVIAITQQISGINAVFFFAPTIFEMTGIGKDASFSQAILVGLINLVFTVFAMIFIDKIGRKPLLIAGMTGIIFSHFMLANTFDNARYTINNRNIENLPQQIDRGKLDPILNKVYDNEIDFLAALKGVVYEPGFEKYESQVLAATINVNSILILIGILGFVAYFAFSLGPVMWVLLSEIFPNRIRAVAISLVGFINSGMSFLVQLVFPWELTNLGNSTTFYIYGLFVFCGLLFVIFKVPETKGKSLERIEEELVKG